MPNHKIQELLDNPEYIGKALGTTKDDIIASFLHYLFFGIGRLPKVTTHNDQYVALALAIRDRVFEHYIHNVNQFEKRDQRAVAYLSAEYLPGPHLHNNLVNLEIYDQTRQAMIELDIKLEDLFEQEEEPGLGNGGLGRLASCYMEAMATLGVPSIGYGIRYEFGIFDQTITDGWQSEVTDKWLQYGNPWEVVRPEISYHVNFGGYSRTYHDKQGKLKVEWKPDFVVKGVAYDTPIPGYRGACTLLRLWKAEAVESFDFGSYDKGDYYGAVEAKISSENITKVLYPSDHFEAGKELRLRQQVFFVSCALQDIIHINLIQGRKLEDLPKKFAVQLNDTHPAISVAELMRLLLDEHEMEWDKAWNIVTSTFAYTNHTLLPEALEKWPVSMFERLLPRHLAIIYEINHRFLSFMSQSFNCSGEQLADLSIIEEGSKRNIRMAHLAVIGSRKVNGVSAHHTELLKDSVLNHFYKIWPEKFANVTNGVTQRRFMAVCNNELSSLISHYIGNDWLVMLDHLNELEVLSEDKTFLESWEEVKRANKIKLANHLATVTGVNLNPDALFDIQAKRIHEYKRQHLKILHILYLYLEFKSGRLRDMPEQSFIFAGKAAPSYHMAKLIIRLIHAVADLVNNDPETKDRLQVVFMPDFNVKNAQRLYPAADLSEQISMAGKEASGTGNMKFSLNGALTIGTLDGANVEIREAVGAKHFFLFGLKTEEVQEVKTSYSPKQYLEQHPHLNNLLHFLLSETLTRNENELFKPIFNNLMWQDPYLVLRDFQDYHRVYQKVLNYWKEKDNWNRSSVLNVARMGHFSADRSIRDYCNRIWDIETV